MGGPYDLPDEEDLETIRNRPRQTGRPSEHDLPDADLVAVRQRLIKELLDKKDDLTQREAQVVTLRNGLDNKGMRTIVDIAKLLDCTPCTVSRSLESANRKLGW